MARFGTQFLSDNVFLLLYFSNAIKSQTPKEEEREFQFHTLPYYFLLLGSDIIPLLLKYKYNTARLGIGAAQHETKCGNYVLIMCLFDHSSA